MPNVGAAEARSIEDLTLRDLLTLAPGDIPDPSLAAGVDLPDLRALQTKLSALPLAISWSRVQSETAGMLAAAMDAKVLSLWAGAWKKYQGLMDDVEKSRKSPKAVVLSSLAAHSMNSSLHPYLEFYLGPQKIRTIRFDVTLTTQIKGLVLGIQNARIMSLQLAECEWRGRIGIGDFTLVERDLKKLSLPGRVEFKQGIPLGAADA